MIKFKRVEDKETVSMKERKIIAVGTILVGLFIPTISNVTIGIGHYGVFTERTYYWPWLILIRKTTEAYTADQWVVSGFPVSIIIFIPFMYMFKYSIAIYRSDDKIINNSALIAFTAFLQMAIIFIMSKSQQINREELVSIKYYPQWIIIVFHAYYSFNKFYSDYQRKINVAMKNKTREE